jgi:hypothetical protein
MRCSAATTFPRPGFRKVPLMPSPILKYFAYQQLPEKLQSISRPICELAHQMDAAIPDSAEKSAGLRKLLEAKDCLVRAALD